MVTEETRQKIRKNLNRLWATPEYRLKMIEAHKKSIITKEQRKKMIAGIKRAHISGKYDHLLGRKISEEHRAKLSKSLIAYHKKNTVPPTEWTYHKKAIDYYGDRCNICGKSNIKLVVHHRDKNRNNHNIENLQVLCNKCHTCEVHPDIHLKYLVNRRKQMDEEIKEYEKKCLK